MAELEMRKRPLLAAIPIFEHLTALDAFGPYQILAYVHGLEVVFVSDKAGFITAGHEGSKFRIEATKSFDDVPAPDIILVPGGPTDKIPMHDKRLLDWIRKTHETTMFTTSVCTGALLLGAAGILKGVEATTHWASFKALAELGAKPISRRYVRQGKIITAAGVSSGIDMGLYLACLLKSYDTARAIQLMVEYDPQPPFEAGSVEKAGPYIVENLHKLLNS